MSTTNDIPQCEFCSNSECDLYEGWYYSHQRLNPFAKETASAGVIQLRVTCKTCHNKLVENGMAKAEKILCESFEELGEEN